MTGEEFLSLARKAHPALIASLHGAMPGSRTKMSVAIQFSPGGKIYEYAGTYKAILEAIGVRGEWAIVNKKTGERSSRYFSRAEAEAILSKRPGQAEYEIKII